MAQAGAYLGSISSAHGGSEPLFEISGNLRRENISLFRPRPGLADLLYGLLLLVCQLVRSIGGFTRDALLLVYFKILCNTRLKILDDRNIIRALRKSTRSEENTESAQGQIFRPHLETHLQSAFTSLSIPPRFVRPPS